MKKLTLRSSLALACALGIAACGGSDDGDLGLSGTVYGLTGSGLILQNNGGWDLPVAAGSSRFFFKERLSSDTNYHVTVLQQPSNATCTEKYNKGKTGNYPVMSVEIHCQIIQHNLRGDITGLTGKGLIINNGSERLEIAANSSKFNFTRYNEKNKAIGGQVGQESPYGVTIFQQPDNPKQTCSVSKGTGIVGLTDVTDVLITCI